MRVKNLWYYVPVPAKLKLIFDRVTLSKITILYVAFAVVHCIIQVILQVMAFKVNANAANFLNDIIVRGNASEAGFSVFSQDLRMCYTVPKAINAKACPVVWSGNRTDFDNGAIGQDIATAATSSLSSSSSSVTPAPTNALSIDDAVPTSSTSVASLPTFPAEEDEDHDTHTTSTTVGTTITVTAATSRPTLPIALLKPGPEGDGEGKASSTTSTVTVTVQAQPTNGAGSTSHPLQKRNNPVVTSTTDEDGDIRVQVSDASGENATTLSETCLVALNWPLARVDNTKREDLVFVCFSVWVLGMSLVAVLNESPPHMVASFVTHMMATSWAAFQLSNTRQFHTDFTRLTTHGACGVNLLPGYWTDRARAEVPILVLNAVGLVMSAILSWRLMKTFGWQTFKRIGASLTMSRAYRIILVFSIVIQLSVFFIVVAVALWIDQVYNGEIARLTEISTAFRAVTIIVLILMLPWLTMGWISVRREYRNLMHIFLFLSLAYLGGWSAMFVAPTFRWTFVEWRFFSLMMVASALLALAALILGIVCRLNFGKGLPRYLNAQEQIPDDDDFVPAGPYSEKVAYEEKVEFPAYEIPLPTYAATYTPPTAPQGGRVLGPRFFAAPANPADLQPDSSLTRQGSGRSVSSQESDFSVVSGSYKTKRWLIE